jgi:hypothetical protein
MRKYLVSLLTVTALPFVLLAQQTSSEPHLRKAFEIVKLNDSEAYLKLFPTFDQMKTMMNEMKEHTSDLDEREMMSRTMDNITAQQFDSMLRKELLPALATIIQKGEALGINWAAAEFSEVKFAELGMHMDKEMEKEMGISMASGAIRFQYEKEKFELLFFSAMKTGSSENWYGPVFIGVREQKDKDLDFNSFFEFQTEVTNDTSFVYADTAEAILVDSAAVVEWNDVELTKVEVTTETQPAPRVNRSAAKPAKAPAKSPARKPKTKS